MIDRNDVLNLAYQDSDISDYMMTLYNLIVQGNYKTIVELGAGRSSVALIAAANRIEGEVWSCDLFESSLIRGGQDLKQRLLEEPRFHLIVADDMEVVKTWNKKIDFLFLDTSHTYEHTRLELAWWPHHVRKGGMIFMHDTGHESGDGVECRQALNEYLAIKGKNYTVIHLMDRKILGASILVKL